MLTEQVHIQADVDIRIAVLDGYLEGNLKASHQVILERNARMDRDIHTLR
jgi:cytoskeletal protein CcmA (bactofilin family)